MNYRPQKGKNGVVFYYLGDEDTKSVSVAGTFNSWNSDKNLMKKLENNLWTAEVEMPEGRHLYKIVVNGSQWILDPQNPNISEDAQNNSSMVVTEEEVLIRSNEISKENPGYMYKNFYAVKSPEWVEKAIIYELHLRAFTENGFIGLRDKLDYIKELGVNVLWIMPFNEIGEEKRIGKYGDPYAVKDYLSIDRSFGTREELKEFILEAHKKGVKVIMDLPINRGSIDNILTKTNPDFFTQDENHEIYYEVPGREYFAGLNFSSAEMRKYIISVMKYWIAEFDFDGFRLDDSDLTPRDFLAAIRKELKEQKDEIMIISQAYDEYHHIDSCDLTYDGILRTALKDFIDEKIDSKEFINILNSYKYFFPQKSLRMRWIEEKEQSRASLWFGDEMLYSAASLLMLLEGIPFIMMGQEFNEKTYVNWTSLFNEYQLDWSGFDKNLFQHYKSLISIRKSSSAFWKGDLEFVENLMIGKSLAFIRKYDTDTYLIMINFSKYEININLEEKVELLYSSKGKRENMLDAFGTRVYRFL